MTRPRALSVTALVAILIAFAGGVVSAWSAPFGAPHPAADGISASGVSGWIFAEQAAFYRSLSGFIRASKEDGAAMWGLFGISFLYGVFHAAGPGHGKAVISSYLIANEETWRRSVVLSFASAGINPLSPLSSLSSPPFFSALWQRRSGSRSVSSRSQAMLS